MQFSKSKKLQKIAEVLIPSGAHTYSKATDQFPQLSPGFIARGQGAYFWDVDGNKFLDWGMALRTSTLGYSYQPVINVVKNQLNDGANFTLPSKLEVELAKIYTNLIPCAEMVKFNKNGSATTTFAVKLARAYTGRDMVAMVEGSYNGSSDWGMASTQMTAGIPKAVRGLTITFKYNDIESVKTLFKKYSKKIACVILEPATEIGPENNFLTKLKNVCHKNGAVLIFDEIISGFRWHVKGAQHYYGVTPDLATFGKATANGYSIAALCGKKKIMKLGNIKGKQKRVFLMSSTHGAENHALVAAAKTIEELKKHKVSVHINKIGLALKKKLNAVTKKNNLSDVIEVYGVFGGRLSTKFSKFGQYNALTIKTYLMQEMIAQGVLYPGYFSPSWAHKTRELNITVKAWDQACQKLRQALDDKNLEKKLVGNPVKPVFRKNN